MVTSQGQTACSEFFKMPASCLCLPANDQPDPILLSLSNFNHTLYYGICLQPIASVTFVDGGCQDVQNETCRKLHGVEVAKLDSPA